MIQIPAPSVAHKGPNDTDASMMRAAATRVAAQQPWGSNLTAAVVQLLDDTANALERTDTTIGQLNSNHIGQILTLQLPRFTVRGEVTHIHHQQGITQQQIDSGARCYVRVESGDGFSWSDTIPAETAVTIEPPLEPANT